MVGVFRVSKQLLTVAVTECTIISTLDKLINNVNIAISMNKNVKRGKIKKSCKIEGT